MRSVAANHVGAGIIRTLITPPRKKNAPTVIAGTQLTLRDILVAINAPTNVPNAWAKNGKRKCLGSSKWMDAFKP